MGRGVDVIRDLEVRDALHIPVQKFTDPLPEPQPTEESELIFTVHANTFGKPDQKVKTVWSAARQLYHVFGDRMTIEYDGQMWTYDPQEGGEQGSFTPIEEKVPHCDQCGCTCVVCEKGHAFGRHTMECYDRVVLPTEPVQEPRGGFQSEGFGRQTYGSDESGSR